MNTHDTRREDAPTRRALSFAYIPKGKKKQQHTQRPTKTMQEDNKRTTKTKPQKIGEEHKRRANTRTRKMKKGGKYAASHITA